MSKVSWWVMILIAGLLGMVVYGYLARPGWVGVADKTLWDWMQLLIVPLLLAGGAYLFNSNAQRRHDDLVEQAQKEREEMAAIQREQDEGLRAYLDQVNRLVLEGRLFEEPDNSYLRRLAQASTLQTLLSLDRERKRRPLTLIYELGLISKDDPIISLKNAGLDTADLSEVILHDAGLREADLRRANLRGADLKGSDLTGADLRGADLSLADLSDTCLVGANLLPYDERVPAELSITRLLHGIADPSDVDVDPSDAYVIPTNLRDANLSGADLRGAYLTGTDVTTEQLATCKTLEGATMPNGQKYEDWRKSKYSGQDKENSDPS